MIPSRQQKRGHRTTNTAALHSAEGEAATLSANVPAQGASLRPSGVSSPAVEPNPDRDWLLAELLARGAEKPSASLSSKGVWTCRDGRRTLGRCPASKVRERDTAALASMFDLRAAVTLRLSKGPFEILWPIARAMPHVQRVVTLGLLKGENGERNPMSWAYTRGVQACSEWATKQREWAGKAKNVEQRMRALRDAETAIGSGVVVAATKRASDRFGAWERTKQTEAAPPWSKAIGFDLSEQHVSLETLGDDRIVAKLTLLGMKAGRRQAQPVFRVSPQGGAAWATVRRILSGEYKARSARVVHDDRVWLLKLSYTMPRPERKSGDKTMLVRRGMSNMLMIWYSDAEHGRAKASAGDNLIAIKRQMEARRTQVRKHLPHQGKGARGHGKARFFRLYEELGNKEARYVDTWCQQTAAFLTKLAAAQGCGRILLEDFGNSTPPEIPGNPYLQRLLRRFPFAQLRACITWAATKAGIEVQVQQSDYTIKCPVDNEVMACNEKREAQCPKCGLSGQLDDLNAWRLFDAAGIKHEVGEEIKRRSGFVSAVRQAKRSRGN